MQEYINPYLKLEEGRAVEGLVRWKSPSNIAIVKYWGKYGQQLPRNPSISFTLQNAFTDTLLQYFPKTGKSEGITLKFNFEGAPKPAFEKKINDLLESLLPIFPFIQQLQLHIHSTNSFPHSAGIASSASSMSALALCLCSLEQTLFGTLSNKDAFLQKASFVARLGSGSACRSVFPLAARWGASRPICAGHWSSPASRISNNARRYINRKQKRKKRFE
jgi:diphosphomevalonate decarboxylase